MCHVAALLITVPFHGRNFPRGPGTISGTNLTCLLDRSQGLNLAPRLLVPGDKKVLSSRDRTYQGSLFGQRQDSQLCLVIHFLMVLMNCQSKHMIQSQKTTDLTAFDF